MSAPERKPPPAHTIRLVPTKEKQQKRREQKASEQSDNRGDAARVTKRDGTNVPQREVLIDVRSELQKLKVEASLATLSDKVGVDLHQCQPQRLQRRPLRARSGASCNERDTQCGRFELPVPRCSGYFVAGLITGWKL